MLLFDGKKKKRNQKNTLSTYDFDVEMSVM